MVNSRYEKKKEVKFGNGTGSPFLLITSFLPVLRLILIFNQNEESTETSIGSFFAILFCFKILGLLYSVGKVYIKSTK